MRLGSSPHWESQLFLIVISNMLIIPWFDSGRGFWGGIKVREREQGTERQLAGRKTCDRAQQQLQTVCYMLNKINSDELFKLFVWGLLYSLSSCWVLSAELFQCQWVKTSLLKSCCASPWQWCAHMIMSCCVNSCVVSISSPSCVPMNLLSWSVCHLQSDAGWGISHAVSKVFSWWAQLLKSEGKHFLDMSVKLWGHSWFCK